MKTRAKISLILILVLALVTVGTVAAQEGSDSSINASADSSCTIDSETITDGWTVVAIDGETVWLLTDADELCTVVLTGESEADHPITELLAEYLAKQNGSDIGDTIDENQVCALFTEAAGEDPASWEIVPCGTEGAVRIIGANEDGTLIVLGDENGSLVADTSIMVHTSAFAQFWSDLLTALGEANANLGIDLILDEEGDLVNFAEEITALRNQGLGYGVIVKLISMSEEFGVPVENLATEFQSTGMGEMFKLYGKPTKLGVGHVRNDMENRGKGPKQEMTGEETSDTTVTANGPGNKPDVPPGQQKKQDNQTTELQNQGPGNGKPGKSNNGKAKGKP